MHPSHRRTSAALLALLASASLLTACGREDERTAGQKVDQAIATTENKAKEVAADAREAGRDASQAMGAAVDSASSKSKDMAITAEVKTRLARDDKLSALAINVDTDAGKVVLRGSAPDSMSRTRATELAQGVDGVVAVANELNVQPKSN
jgi:osmotically-inducible protein OsmY